MWVKRKRNEGGPLQMEEHEIRIIVIMIPRNNVMKLLVDN